MQRDAEILPVNIRMKEIRDRFAIWAICAVSPRNPVCILANSNKPAEGDLGLLESNKWMVLMMTNIWASVHYGSSQSMIAIRNLMKLYKSWKAVCILLYEKNGKKTITCQVKTAITTPLSRGSCMEGSTLIHWNPLRIVCLIISSVSYFRFVQVMVFWESISRREESRNEIIIASVVSWKQLNTSSRNVLCIL